MLYNRLKFAFLLLLVILQASLLLAWKHIFSSVVQLSLLHGENRCIKKDLLDFLVLLSKLQFWTLGRQGQGSCSRISHRKLCLSRCHCNLIIKDEEKMPLFSDTYISSAPCSRPYPLEDEQMKCFKLTLYVKFTLLKRKLCFGGCFKGKLVWTWEGFFCTCNNSLSCPVAHIAALFQPAGGFPGRVCHMHASRGFLMHLQILSSLGRHGPFWAECSVIVMRCSA